MTFYMPDSWYDPPQVDDWEAAFYCDQCEKDTEHYFARQGHITHAQCTECTWEQELDPDYFEDD